ncbi:ATP-binding protein [Maricaulis salignorans]|uniref:Histidine kinase-, DNA gyrase B-, and HSP90-like ATPase n=1 Tax=Maricaulis salignorans TaxID=144026 RepID=A0A1G9RMJ8_9PROT|nr:ATP-binding protein [Maricaulis salignorans]SDM24414.1 Histidine kinase-, DNA gyrase B-, and HSP90-like ATPase [Maricaulis salignorans]
MQDAEPIPFRKDGQEVQDYLRSESYDGGFVVTDLEASDRVIARVTDGIYREPAAAFRELISNAWDADASRVTIHTDAPRFSRVTVSDDGRGMSLQTLTRLIKSIGGSAKRTHEGKELGITSKADVGLTPNGRPIIGKIGVGMFAVSQLARQFTIATKVEGESYRTIAEIHLRTYEEDNSAQGDSRDGEDSFRSGKVFIKTEPTEDTYAHGTDIIISYVKPNVRKILSSTDRWRLIDEKDKAALSNDWDTFASIKESVPAHHIGQFVGATREGEIKRGPSLPWSSDTPADERMSLLMDAVESQTTRVQRPDLSSSLDAYLHMVWNLALSSPVRYVGPSPFELSAKDSIKAFWLPPDSSTPAQELDLTSGCTVREAARDQVAGAPLLMENEQTPVGSFDVDVDGILLRRPIRYRHISTGERGLPNSLLFVGKFKPDLSKVDPTIRGGDLSFDGYLFWNGRVIPRDNNGVLIRIRGASSAYFDESFLNYKISETTRLRQIVSEIFVHDGVDAALNIDRESFNYAHPHIQFVQSWLHRSLRKLTNKHKEISRRLRDTRKLHFIENNEDFIESSLEELWQRERGDEPRPSIEVFSEFAEINRSRDDGNLTLDESEISKSIGASTLDPEVKRQATAIYEILLAFDLLTEKSFDQHAEIVAQILKVVR